MPNRTIFLKSLGCSKNTVDSEHIVAALSDDYCFVESTPADIFLLNTCSFIADAKQESIDEILSAVELKKIGRFGKIVVFGCLPQRYANEMPELIPEVDAWFGARDFDPLLEYLGSSHKWDETRRELSTPKSYAFLKISEGCDRRCSYCAIPFIRGAHHSVPVEELVEEARCLAAKGVKELIVIAQDSTYYGLDLYGKRDLARLLHALSEVDGIEWIRIHYSYPASFPEDVLKEMAENPKICKYMDIPLQHISTDVLKMMHRGVDAKQTKDLVAVMRQQVPGVALRTTMIVGHPGESQEDFEQLLAFVKETRFERLGAFTYSEEEDTYSAQHYADDIPQEVKQERLDRLMVLQESISYEYNRSRIGSRERVLVDSADSDVLVCRSQFESPEVDGEILVKLPKEKSPEDYIGRFFEVKIVGADSYDLIAEFL